MINLLTSLTGLLLLNSMLLIGFIFPQNESAKEAIPQSSSSLTTPFERLTWISLILQLVLLLIKIKLSDF